VTSSGPPGQICEDTNNLATIFPGLTLTHDASVLIVNDFQKFNVLPASECKFIEDNGGASRKWIREFRSVREILGVYF